LQTRAQAGGSLTDVASVASFFVSRIDTEIDARLDARLAAAAEPAHKQALSALRGQIAIANAKLAYRLYETLLSSDTWKELASRGARPQRLLWASTGTKDKAYSDVLYVDQLIGRDTVNTVPPQTLDAFRDHGAVAETLTADVDGARAKMQALADAGISMQEVTQGLLDCGLALFSDAMDGLLATVASLQRKIRGSRLTRTQSALPGALHDRVEAALTAWDVHGNTGRLWARDPSLWTDSGEERWLGWLDGVATQQTHTAALQTFAREVQAQDIHDVVVIGMGGSSLCPDVLSRTYGAGQVAKGWPRLRILDSTVPAQVAAMREAIDPAHTLFVVASKSGTTLEPTVLCESLFELATSKLGGGAGAHFVAITDPGSKLQALAERDGYAHVFPGVPEIGGRFSALSNFGMVPAAAMGLDTGSVLAEAERMVEACRTPKASDNPGVLLGTILATAAAVGRNKLTLVLSPAIAGFGAWIEQLVAESTGKEGKAIIPVDGETPTAPERYSNDRLFVYVRSRPGPGRRGPGSRRPGGGTDRARRRRCPAPGVLPLGDRHCRRRGDHADPSVRPTRRRSCQGGHAGAHQRLRDHRNARRTTRAVQERGDQPVHRPRQRASLGPSLEPRGLLAGPLRTHRTR
jgi:transaldolase/glucose-6-phosphate isomerase